MSGAATVISGLASMNRYRIFSIEFVIQLFNIGFFLLRSPAMMVFKGESRIFDRSMVSSVVLCFL